MSTPPPPGTHGPHPSGNGSATDEDDLRDALTGLRFPADRHAALAYATDRGALDDHLLDLLHTAPDRVYSSVDDLLISLPDDAEPPARGGAA